MARVKIAGTSGASENTIVFSSAGGHSHNGRNSSLIDSTAYSMYDFSPTFVGTEVNPDRAVRQENNRIAFEDVIKRVVNNSVLAPAGIRLEAGSLNGSLIIANTITANNLAANTITADEIAAGAITANELSSNIVLINNRITSQNWDGTIQSNGTIFANGIGTSGWAITNTHAVFDSTLIRGSIAANSLLTPNLTISNTGAISSTNFNVTAGGNVTATNANITGTITSGSGTIGGWTIDTARIYGGSTYLYSNGSMSIGATTIAANGRITNGGYTLSASGALSATGASITGTVNAELGTIGGWSISGSSLINDTNGNDQYIELDADSGIFSRRYTGSFYGSGFYTDILINYGGMNNGIMVAGNGSGTYKETRVCSSFIESDQVFIAAGSIQTLLNGKAGSTHTHNYAASSHTHSYLPTSGGTLSGDLTVDSQLFISAALGTNTDPALRVNRSYDSTGGYFVEFTNTNGTVRAGYIRYVLNSNNSVFYATSSDARLKDKVDIDVCMLDKINEMKPVYYTWKNSDPNSLFYGFMAQELYEVFPEAVSQGDDSESYIMDDGQINVPDSWGVDYSKLVPPLVKAVQELSAKVESLEDRIKTLEGV